MKNKRVTRLAKNEVGWWKAHHRRNVNSFLEHKTRVLIDLFGVTEEKATRAVREYIKAADEHDLAEYYEDRKEQEKADLHWNNVYTHLLEYFCICTGTHQHIKPGRYRHFKGKEYYVLGVAIHTETDEPMVVYRALYGEGTLYVRPLKMFSSQVEITDEKGETRTVERFKFIE